MGLLRDSRAVKKWKAYRRAEFGLKQRWERIDFEEDELIPEVEAMLAGKSVAQLPARAVFDFKVIDAHQVSDDRHPAGAGDDTTHQADAAPTGGDDAA